MSSITLRKAQPRTETAAAAAAMERRWNPSPAVQMGTKLVGEQGQKAVVAAWLKAALLRDEEARTTIQDIYARLGDTFPFPPSIPPPTTPNDLIPMIMDALPSVAVLEGNQIAARLQNVDFEHCAEIWASVGWDMTVWVLQYVQSRLSVNKVKGGVKEEAEVRAGHGLVGTGVSLTCHQGTVQVDEARGDFTPKIADAAATTSTNLPPPPVTKPIKATAAAVPTDKIPDSAFTLLNTSSLPFPHLSIRKNFRTIVVDSIPVSKIIPPPSAGPIGAPVLPPVAPPVDVDAEEPEMKTFERIVSTGKYTEQVLGRPGSVRVAKAWLHAWLVPSAAQNISSVTDLTTTTSKRSNKDKVNAVKHVEATSMTPLSDIYDVYSRYGFHPPSCPILSFSEFHDLLRNVDEVAAENSTTEPVWNQPNTGLLLRNDIPLDLLRSTPSTTTLPLESPNPATFENPPSASPLTNTASSVLVQASFRYPPNEFIDAEPYLAPAAETGGTNPTPAPAVPVTKGKHFKEHDIVWRSVGLNLARWVKAEKGKRTAKAELEVASALGVERERERKRQRLEFGEPPVQMQNGGPGVQGGQRQGQGQGMAQPSMFVRPAQPKTPEERRRIMMTAWLQDNYTRHGDPNFRIEQKTLWQSFLAQVVRTLPPWESEMFTYMRPNELFGLTTEIWGTKLSAEEAPPGADGVPARQTFWICGIVPKQSRVQPSLPPVQQQQQPQQMRMMPPPRLPSMATEQKMNTIQPRNPLMHAVQQKPPPSRFLPNPGYNAQPSSAASSSRSQDYPPYVGHQQQSIPTSTSSHAYQSHPHHSQPPMVPSMGSDVSRQSYPPVQQPSERPLHPAHVSPRNSLSGYLAPLPEPQQHRSAHDSSMLPPMYAPATSLSHHPIPRQSTWETPSSRESSSTGIVLPLPPLSYHQSRLSSFPFASGSTVFDHAPLRSPASHPHGDGAGNQK
ncbi:hypothetical protein QFC21_002158 [Naganishia friedmannii]|uniref:Uncharacterized protein n=1 Tax=Naganishia friedmannii TaxID=89922 RepID=A0ACC2W004_9TREE|nr:hypothetical protein QFC21_002158 [Naganishia friedmannii]